MHTVYNGVKGIKPVKINWSESKKTEQFQKLQINALEK